MIRNMETITIPKNEYKRLKQDYKRLKQLEKKAEIADDAIIQLKLSLEDLRHKRVSKFN